jgi:hypothetical protein
MILNEEILNLTVKRDTYILVGEIDDLDLIDKLAEEVKRGIKEKTISTNVTNHTVFNFFIENPLFHKFLKIIHRSIYKIYKQNFIIKDAWGNIYFKKGDVANKHTHKGVSAFCGILYCTDGPGPGTYFEDYDITIQEKKGRFVLFDPILIHGVKEFDYNKERITIAWNFMEIKKWSNFTNVYKVNPKDEQIVL